MFCQLVHFIFCSFVFFSVPWSVQCSYVLLICSLYFLFICSFSVPWWSIHCSALFICFLSVSCSVNCSYVLFICSYLVPWWSVISRWARYSGYRPLQRQTKSKVDSQRLSRKKLLAFDWKKSQHHQTLKKKKVHRVGSNPVVWFGTKWQIVLLLCVTVCVDSTRCLSFDVSRCLFVCLSFCLLNGLIRVC